MQSSHIQPRDVGGRFEVVVDVPWLAEGAFDVQGTRPVPPPAIVRKLGVLTPEQTRLVEGTLQLWFGLRTPLEV